MAGPRNKRKRTEAPTDVAPDRGRGAIGTEPSKVSRTDDTNAIVPDPKLSLSNDNQPVAPSKETPLQTQNGVTDGDGNDHAEPEKQTLSLVDQNALPGSNANSTAPDVTMLDASAELLVPPSDDVPGMVSESKPCTTSDLLEHRKLLLRRLRQAKSVAQKRIDRILEAEPSKRQESEAQEVSAFNEMARLATAIARKQARAELIVPSEQKKNALRKGSTVGKKMNAALSSLVSGSGAVDPIPDVSNSQPENMPQSASTSIPAHSAALASSGPLAGAQALKAFANKDKSPLEPLPVLSPSDGVSKNVNLAPRPASGVPDPSLGRESVICQETMLLRERKKALESRLATLYTERYQRIKSDQMKDQSVLEFGSLSPVSPSKKVESLPKTTLTVAINGPREPASLPCRRRTHWDSVLDEMKWLATDFVEERKWKRASVKFLSESLVTRARQSESSQNEANDKRENQDAVKTQVVNGGLVRGRSRKSTATTDIGTRSSVSDGVHRYHVESETDNGSARHVAKVISGVIVKASSVMHSGDDGIVNMAARKVNWSESTQEDEGSAAKASSSPPTSDCINDRITVFESISKRVESALSHFSKSRGGKNSRARPDELPFSLSSHQISSIEFIEDAWQRSLCGVQLGGSDASGKTVLVAALLYRHRCSGPQMLVCNSTSVKRWMYEIGRLEDVNLRTIDRFDGASNAKDIFVCDYTQLSLVPSEKISAFSSVVVDLRFPQGFGASRTTTHSKNTGKQVVGIQAPAELVSTGWWSRLVGISSSFNRILIDAAVPYSSYTFVHPEVRNRQTVELLALRSIFLLGLSECSLPGYSLQKLALAWARWKIKHLNESASKLDRVWTWFSDILTKLSYRIEEDLVGKMETFEWDVRLCTFTHSQKLAYESACHEFRPILSSSGMSLGRENAYEHISLALLSLRRLCLHADAFEVLAKISGNNGWDMFDLPSGHGIRSSSQPDRDVAALILNGSAKFRELVRILDKEHFIKPSFRDAVASFLHGEDQVFPGKHETTVAAAGRRLVVLAALPEGRALVSLLLNVLGVSHSLIEAKSMSDTADGLTDRSAGQFSWAAIAQAAMLHFNSDTNKFRVLVASPESVAGDHAGLGVEMADVVVLLDDDWSGRGELVLKSLRKRCSARHRFYAMKKGCQYIRLVASSSCEASFLDMQRVRQLNGAPCEDDECFWPVRADGVYSSCFEGCETQLEASTRLLETNAFYFPAKNILYWKNTNLSDVLVATAPGRELLLPSSRLFLPNTDDMALALSLIRSEETVGLQFTSALRLAAHTASVPREIQGHSLLQLPLTTSGILTLPLRRYFARVSCCASGDDIEPCVGVSLTRPTTTTSTDVVSVNSLARSEASEVVPNLLGGSVESFLFYPSNKVVSECHSRRKESMIGCHRVNSYSFAFSNAALSRNLLDGTIGSEVALYTPPILPGVLECAAQARLDVDSIRSRKRLLGIDFQQSNKRFRDDGELSIMTEDEASHSDAASVLFDLEDDYGLAGLGAVPLPIDSALLAGLVMAGVPRTTPELSAGLWFPGLLSCDAEEEARDLYGYGTASIDKVLLFISRKRSRDGTVYPTQLSGVAWASSGAQLQGINSSFQDMNGKRFKKKPSNAKDAGASAFSRLSPTNQTVMGITQAASQVPIPPSKPLDPQARALFLSKKENKARSLFEAPSYHYASVRVKNRVADRMDRLCWNSPTAFDVGPGLPLIVKQYWTAPGSRNDFAVDPALWTSIVKRLRTRDCMTGDESIGVAVAQRVALRRSFNGPCRVDFGPFQCGFLAQPSGMSAAMPPRHHRSGVALPMGVKVHLPKEILLTPWTRSEDDLLQRSVARFGMNWILISRVLSGFHQGVTSASSIARAPRVCRDRWQMKVRSHPALAREIRDLSEESLATDNASIRRVTVNSTQAELWGVPSRDIEFLVLKETQTTSEGARENSDAMEVDEVHSPASVRNQKRSFASFKNARAKKIVAPVAIPGVSGNTATTLPVHPSHTQAIQAAVSSTASFSSTGRTEMWPLQLLEILDRQRAAQQAPPQPTVTVPGVPAAKASMTSSSRTQVKQSVAPSARPASMSATVAQSRSPMPKQVPGSSPLPKTAPAMAASFNPPPTTKAVPPVAPSSATKTKLASPSPSKTAPSAVASPAKDSSPPHDKGPPAAPAPAKETPTDDKTK